MVLLHLEKGYNHLLVKVDQKDQYPQLWSFAVALQTPRYALRMARLNAVTKILKKHIYARGEPLQLSPDLYDSTDVSSVSLVDEHSGALVSVKRAPACLTELTAIGADVPEGVYRSRVVISDEIFEEPIYIGDVRRPLNDWRRTSLARLRFGARQVRWDASALVIRYAHLLSSEHYKPSDVVWQKKMIFLARELEEIRRSVLSNDLAYKHRPGLHLQAYKSTIDFAVQYYMVYVPRAYTGRPVPLVLHIHPTMSIHRPFLKSLVVAHPYDVEALCQQAEKHGFAILWPWARGNSRGNAIGTSDVLEALLAVQRNFEINQDKIYVEGTCEGGTEALLLAARFPQRFAAVAAIAPITDETAMGDSAAHRPTAPPRLDAWAKLNSPMALAPNLSNLPVMILHGQNDEMIPLAQSRDFVDACQQVGIKPQFSVLPNTGHSYAPVEPVNLVFDFFQNKARIRSPERVHVNTSSTYYGTGYWIRAVRIDQPLTLAQLRAVRKPGNVIEVSAQHVWTYEINLSEARIPKGEVVTVWTNGTLTYQGVPASEVLSTSLARTPDPMGLKKCCGVDGSIDHAVGSTFGAITSAFQPGSGSSLQNALASFWRQEYFVDLPRLPSPHSSESQGCEANTIQFLTASGRSTRATNHIAGVPVKLEQHRILLGDHVYSGDNLAFQMVYPHPRCRGKYIVLMGMTGARSVALTRFYSPSGAWYDFVVWNGQEQTDDGIVDVGFFDADWRKLISVKEEIR